MERIDKIYPLRIFKGLWVGKGKLFEHNINTSLTIENFAPNILEYSIKAYENNSIVLNENGYVFQNNILDELQQLVISSEGYGFIADISIKETSKKIILTSSFKNGINLPPNITISTEWSLNKKPLRLSYKILMGSNLSVYFCCTCEKASKNSRRQYK